MAKLARGPARSRARVEGATTTERTKRVALTVREIDRGARPALRAVRLRAKMRRGKLNHRHTSDIEMCRIYHYGLMKDRQRT